MGTRQKTAEPTDLKESLDFAADAVRGWTAQEDSRRASTSCGDSIPVAVERGHSAPEFLRCAGHRSFVGRSRHAEALRDANGDLIKYNFGNTNWIPLMLRDSSFIIQTEEILADVDLLIAMEGVLASGCKSPSSAAVAITSSVGC